MPTNSFPYSLAQTLLWKVRNFPDEVYSFTPENNLTTLMSVLLGGAGTGQFATAQTAARINQQHLEFSDLDTILGFLLNVSRNSNEVYTKPINPFTDQLQLADWKEVWAKDSNFRERLVGIIAGLLRGATLLGVQTLAEAVLQTKVRVVENWTTASGSMLSLNYSRGFGPNEIILIPVAPSGLTPTLNDRSNLLNTTGKIIPTGAVTTVISGAVNNYVAIPFTSISGSSTFFYYQRNVTATKYSPPSNVLYAPDNTVASRYWLQNNQSVQAPYFAHLQTQETIIDLTANVTTVRANRLTGINNIASTNETTLPIGSSKTRVTSTIYGAQ